MKLVDMNPFRTICLIVLALFFSNCNETKKVIEDPASYQIMGTYIVTELNNTNLGKDEEISFEKSNFNKSIKGTTSCNSFFGVVSKEGQSLRFTEMNISENYCNDDVMKFEQNLFRVFNSASSYNLKEDVLSFYSDSDKSVILTATKDTIQ